MDKLTIVELPFVDSPPDEGQTRIKWIKDGEEITGSKTKYSSEGVLNRPILAVQKNVEVLDKNIITIANSLNSANTDIQNIQHMLEISNNTEALAQIGINAKDISTLKTTSNEQHHHIEDLAQKVETIKDDIGTYNPETDSVYRTVRKDLLWIKKELGQYPGQDINGISSVGADSSGMKRRIMDNSSVINQHAIQIKELETKFEDSDVGSLTTEVQNLRAEMGSKPSSFTDPVYVRLGKLETSNSGLQMNMENVLDSIGYNSGTPSIIDVVTTNTRNIEELTSELSSPDTGIKDTITKIERQIGDDEEPLTINGKIKTNSDSIVSINRILGADSSSGLRGDVAWINQTVGITKDGAPAPSGSVIYKVNMLTASQSQTADEIQNLQVEIGNNTEGLKGQVLKLNSSINGTNPNGSTIEERGLLAAAKTAEIDISNLKSLIDSSDEKVLQIEAKAVANEKDITQLKSDVAAIPDFTAIKQDIDTLKGDVSSVQSEMSTTTSSIEDIKKRLTTLETKVKTLESSKFVDAPSDGKAYVRKDGQWVDITTLSSQ